MSDGARARLGGAIAWSQVRRPLCVAVLSIHRASAQWASGKCQIAVLCECYQHLPWFVYSLHHMLVCHGASSWINQICTATAQSVTQTTTPTTVMELLIAQNILIYTRWIEKLLWSNFVVTLTLNGLNKCLCNGLYILFMESGISNSLNIDWIF